MSRPLVTVLVGLLFSPVAAAAGSCERRGEWLVAETPHFEVWSRLSRERTLATADSCEGLRTGLRATWCDEAHRPAWRTKCVVALHADAAAYAAAIGSPGNRSVGCTTLKVGVAGVTFRRVDVRCDASGWERSALPHELTHVVLADRLGGRPLPLWADEGLAVLSEAPATCRKREAALLSALRRRQVYSPRALLGLSQSPPAELRDGFYGQAALVTALLIERETPAEFLAFVEEAERGGYDAALRHCYGIDGVAGLERLWDERTRAVGPGLLLDAVARAAAGSPGFGAGAAVARGSNG